jgi:hypothetical protein
MNIYQYLILHEGRRKLWSDYSTRAINNRGGNRNINIEQPEQATLPSIFGGASRSQSLPPAKRSKRSGYYTIIISFIMVATTIIYRNSSGPILSIILYGLHVK